jgi:hypothetical protein
VAEKTKSAARPGQCAVKKNAAFFKRQQRYGWPTVLEKKGAKPELDP